MFPLSLLLAIDRDVDEGRTLPPHVDGVVKAADEPMDRTAAVIKTLDFMVLVGQVCVVNNSAKDRRVEVFELESSGNPFPPLTQFENRWIVRDSTM